MDEPFEGLAPVIIDELIGVLKCLRAVGEPAILLVEQYTRLAPELTDRAVVLDRGRVVYDGNSRALLNAPARLDSLIGIAAEANAAGTTDSKHSVDNISNTNHL